MSLVVWAILASLVVIWILTLVDLVRRPLERRQRFGWILIVVLLPFVGAIAYWAMRPSTAEEIRREHAAERELSARSPFDRPRSW